MGNIVYLVCSKWGNNSNKRQDKAKFVPKSGEIKIYNQCINVKNLNEKIDFEDFKEKNTKIKILKILISIYMLTKNILFNII